MENLFHTIVSLGEGDICIGVPNIISKGKTGESLIKGFGIFLLSGFPKVIKKENGKFAVLYSARTKFVAGGKKIGPPNICDFEQKFFPTFIMPVLQYANEVIFEEKLRKFFDRLFVKDKEFANLKTKFAEAVKQKNTAVNEKQYVDAGVFREQEKEVYKQLHEYLLPKIEKFFKRIPCVVPDYRDWMEYLKD
jgi:hypothetical protein